jgi:hypothetical protein
LVAIPLQVLEAVEEIMPPETPLAFGLHPNAEIGFKLREAETFCNSLVQLQPRESGGGFSFAICRQSICHSVVRLLKQSTLSR